MTPDVINGLFEFIGGCLLWLSVASLYRDKEIKGISTFPVMFFTAWGFWNLFYYPNLNQWWSFAGGLWIVFANSVWLSQMIYYKWFVKRS